MNRHNCYARGVLFVCALAILGSCDSPANAAGPQPITNRPPAPQEATPAEVVIVPRADTLVGLGSTVGLGAVVVGQNGGVVAGIPVVWTTLSPGVVTVGAESGTVTAVGFGVGSVQASAGPATGEAQVFVLSPPAS